MATAKLTARYSASGERADGQLRSAELHHQPGHDPHEGDGEIEMLARFVIPPHLMLSAVPV